jgi:hypothetical protein
MTTKNQKQSDWKKYLKWAAIVVGVIIVFSAIFGGDDEEGTTDSEDKVEVVGQTDNGSKIRGLEVLGQEKTPSGDIKVRLKNISNRTISNTFTIRVEFTDGVSDTNYGLLDNMQPGDIQEIRLLIPYNKKLASWKFVE